MEFSNTCYKWTTAAVAGAAGAAAAAATSVYFRVAFVLYLNEERNDGLSAAGIITEFFLVISMFTESPLWHLHEAQRGKDETGEALCHHRKRQPWSDLVCVVWTTHKAEHGGERISSWEWDLALSTSRLAEVLQCNVNGKVTDLTQDKSNESSIHLCAAIWGRCVALVVDEVSLPCSKRPIIWAVLEEVSQRHCSMGETMNKFGLQQPLEVVEWVTCSCNVLNSTELAAVVQIEPQVDKQGSSILDVEHSWPADLWSQVFVVDDTRLWGLLQGLGVLESFPTRWASEWLTRDVEIRKLLFVCLLQRQDCGVLRKVLEDAQGLAIGWRQHF